MGQQVKDLPASTWLWAGSAILASGLLDTSVDAWAKAYQSDQWANAAKLSNAVPDAIAMCTGALLTGVADEDYANTAKTICDGHWYSTGRQFSGQVGYRSVQAIRRVGFDEFQWFHKSVCPI